MIVKLYKNTSDNNVVNKSISGEIVFNNVNCHTNKEVVSPSFSFVSTTDLTDYNYCYIPKFKRYYYLNISVGINSVYNCFCTVDTLMSFKDYLLSQKATITRNENLSNGYLLDEKYKSLAYKKVVTKTFSNGLNNDSYVLMTTGGSNA